MIAQCAACQAHIKVPDEKVAGTGVQVRCSSCASVLLVRPDGSTETQEGPSAELLASLLAPTPEPARRSTAPPGFSVTGDLQSPLDPFAPTPAAGFPPPAAAAAGPGEWGPGGDPFAIPGAQPATDPFAPPATPSSSFLVSPATPAPVPSLGTPAPSPFDGLAAATPSSFDLPPAPRMSGEWGAADPFGGALDAVPAPPAESKADAPFDLPAFGSVAPQGAGVPELAADPASFTGAIPLDLAAKPTPLTSPTPVPAPAPPPAPAAAPAAGFAIGRIEPVSRVATRPAVRRGPGRSQSAPGPAVSAEAIAAARAVMRAQRARRLARRSPIARLERTALVLALGALLIVLAVSKLKKELPSHADLKVRDARTGLFDTRAGRPVMYVRGAVENRGSKPRLAEVSVALLRGSTVARRAVATAGAVPGVEEVFEVTSPSALRDLERRLAARARPVEPGASAEFLAIFYEYPEDFADLLLHAEARDAAPRAPEPGSADPPVPPGADRLGKAGE